jgi:hypothetical protein
VISSKMPGGYAVRFRLHRRWPYKPPYNSKFARSVQAEARVRQ